MQLSKSLALAAGTAVMAAGLAVAPASADAPEVIKPTKEEKQAILKAWSKSQGGSGKYGPLKCYTVRLSKHNPNDAGIKTNVVKHVKTCEKWAFDGGALMYGHNGTKWHLLVAGSAIPQHQCKALAHLLGPDAWSDLVNFESALGCENLD